MFQDEDLERGIVNNVKDLEDERRIKIIIYTLIGILLIGLIIVIIIILILKYKSSPKSKIYGLFECTYYNGIGEKAFLFSNDSIDLSPLEITINNKTYYGTNLEINQSGYIKVIIKFNSPLNMDYLFSGTQLNDIKMISNKKGVILSMTETFNNCDRLDYFSISGFDTSQVKNISRLFNKNEELKEVHFNDFNTENVEDMSELFSECGRIEPGQ